MNNQTNKGEFSMTLKRRNVTQLDSSMGKVVFRYETGYEEENHEFDEQVFSKEFHTLSEMTDLLQNHKLDYFKDLLKVNSVAVDSIVFTAASEDMNTKVETLMVDDMIFVELSQKQ